MSTETVADTRTVRERTGKICPMSPFVDDVDAFMAKPENGNNADGVLRKLDELHGKYKFMEANVAMKRKKLSRQLPTLQKTLEILEILKKQTEEFETEYLLSDLVFSKAVIPPTKTVCLWLGANVMLEYSIEDAEELVTKNLKTCETQLKQVAEDLDFLRDQTTTTEVNMARVFNWDVKRRNAIGDGKK